MSEINNCQDVSCEYNISVKQSVLHQTKAKLRDKQITCMMMKDGTLFGYNARDRSYFVM